MLGREWAHGGGDVVLRRVSVDNTDMQDGRDFHRAIPALAFARGRLFPLSVEKG